MKTIKTLLIAILVITYLILIGGMIMAEQTYGYCGSKCKHPVYSKNDTTIFKKSDVAVLTGKIIIKERTNGSFISLDYPEGFTKDNSIIISQMIKKGSGDNYTSGVSKSADGSIDTYYVQLSNKVNISYYLNSTIPSGTGDFDYYYKIALMKYE